MPYAVKHLTMKNPVFIQPLLNAAPQPPPQSRSANSPSIHDNPNPLKPIPVLIEELFDICSPALHKVAMIKPDTPHDTELFIQRNAKTWGANIHFLRSHYTAFKNTISPQELLKQEELEGLYSRIFKVLAESIFHVYKITHSLRDATNPPTTSPSTNWARNKIQQDDSLYGELTQAMKSINSNASRFLFSFDGTSSWNQRKSEEDYSVLYRDYEYKNEQFVAMEWAVGRNADEYARQIGRLNEDLRSLTEKGMKFKGGEDVVEVVEKTEEGYQVKER